MALSSAGAVDASSVCMCVCARTVFSNQEVPITDYQTKERESEREETQNKGEEQHGPLITMLLSAREHHS